MRSSCSFQGSEAVEGSLPPNPEASPPLRKEGSTPKIKPSIPVRPQKQKTAIIRIGDATPEPDFSYINLPFPTACWWGPRYALLLASSPLRVGRPSGLASLLS